MIAAEGGETLESPELVVPKGLRLITKATEEEEGWPKALRQKFNHAKIDGENQLKAKIELAGGNQLYEEPDGLECRKPLDGSGTAFELPLKVRLINPFLERLDGGAPCTVGSDAHPVMQELTDGPSGASMVKFGQLSNSMKNSASRNPNNTLVDGTYTVPVVEGCGGAYESYIDAALNHVLELPGAAEKSSTELTGRLFMDASAEARKVGNRKARRIRENGSAILLFVTFIDTRRLSPF